MKPITTATPTTSVIIVPHLLDVVFKDTSKAFSGLSHTRLNLVNIFQIWTQFRFFSGGAE
jgi:hypothetical protein